MKKIVLILMLAFVFVSIGSLLMGISMDYRSQVIFSSVLLLLISIALGVIETTQIMRTIFLDYLNINNRNFKKELLSMNDDSFISQRDKILDMNDSNKSKILFNIYEDIKIKREKNKKTHNV